MNTFQQVVKNVQGSTALVESKKGNIYPVIVSDFVRLNKTVNVNDIALIRRINGKYYMVDVIKPSKPTDSYMSKIPMGDCGYDY